MFLSVQIIPMNIYHKFQSNPIPLLWQLCIQNCFHLRIKFIASQFLIKVTHFQSEIHSLEIKSLIDKNNIFFCLMRTIYILNMYLCSQSYRSVHPVQMLCTNLYILCWLNLISQSSFLILILSPLSLFKCDLSPLEKHIALGDTKIP